MPGKKIYPLSGSLHTGLRFAVLGNRKKFQGKKHAWKVWKTLKSFGSIVYPVAIGLDRIEGTKVYPSLTSLQGKIDVAVICLLPDTYPQLLEDIKASQVKQVWFQEQTYNDELLEALAGEEIEVIKGCVLLHRPIAKPFAFFSPCYWHGFRQAKVPVKRF